MKELVSELKIRFPLFQKDLEVLNKIERIQPETLEYNTLKTQLNYAESQEKLYLEVINAIKEFREGWDTLVLDNRTIIS